MTCGPGDSHFPIQSFTRLLCSMIVCIIIHVFKAQDVSISGTVELNLNDTVFSYGRSYIRRLMAVHSEKITVFLHLDFLRQSKNLMYRSPLA